MAIQPMHQFLIEKVVELPTFQVGGVTFDMSITNSVMMMLVGAVVLSLLLGAASKGALVPGRLQAIGEAFYGLVDGVLVTPIIGHKGRSYIPFIMSLFMFIFVMNMLGVILSLLAIFGQGWASFTPTSQLAVTVALAALTFISVIVIGFVKNGLGFFKLFVPPGLPLPMVLVMAPIEFISFAVRPLTLSMRLFGNIVGGHVVLYIFASFIISLGLLGLGGGIASLGFLGSAASFAMVVLLSGLELLVAFLQAFVFAALATVYLNEVVNLGHGH
ncbi:MAG TPA: F0F1 ATP synthase subunit A [Caulobacteraceae bacterium]|jgi:F-type H+-transporting ATPase subunit a|nr:F0F1 ATP synthase subunit A [Caulobacteraceae bacterium]